MSYGGNSDFEEIISKIISETGLSRKEIFEKIREVKKEFGEEFISDIGAVHVVARDLGVDVFDTEIIRAQEDNIERIKNKPNTFVTIVGRVTKNYGIKSFIKNGKQGKLASIVISDKSGSIRVVIWGDKVDDIIEKKLKVGDVIKIINGFVKIGRNNTPEIHIIKKSQIKINPPDIDVSDLLEIKFIRKKISEIDNKIVTPIEVEGIVIEISDIKLFNNEKKRASVVIADETGSLRAVFWNEATKIVKDLKIYDCLKLKGFKIKKGLDGHYEIHINNLELIEKKDNEILRNIVLKKLKDIVLIKDISEYTYFANLLGRVSSEPAIKIFSVINGTMGKRISFTLSDKTGCIKVSGWNENIENLLSILKYNNLIEISKCKIIRNKQGEFEARIDNNSLIKITENIDFPSADELPKINSLKRIEFTQISNINSSMNYVAVKGIIVKIINKQLYYNACPVCYSKVEYISRKWICKSCGEISKPIRRYIITFIIDDGTDTIRVTLMGDALKEFLKMQFGEKVDLDNITYDTLNDTLIGLLVGITGKVKYNDFIESFEIIANQIFIVDILEKVNDFIKRKALSSNES